MSERTWKRIAELIYTRRSVSGRTPVDVVAKLFDAETDLDALATLESDGSFGLVLRSRLTRELGRQFGYALFARKPIHIFNEVDFLSCAADEDPAKVIGEATKRSESTIYDDIVVVQNGAYHGLVSMRLLMAHSKDLLMRSLAAVDALEERNEKLDQLNRAQREFVANVTHELRAPLNTMLGVANLLSLDQNIPESRQRDVRVLLSRGRDLLGLTNNLLELHRLESGDVRPEPAVTDLVEMLDDCIESARYLVLDRPVELVGEYGALPAGVWLDSVLLRRILTNLLSNAAKFTERGRVTLTANLDGERLLLGVADTGIGIRPTDIPKLFRKFTQLEATKTKRHAGTGLGLVIVRDLVELMGGSVSVESNYGAGTTFRISLPAAPRTTPESS